MLVVMPIADVYMQIGSCREYVEDTLFHELLSSKHNSASSCLMTFIYREYRAQRAAGQVDISFFSDRRWCRCQRRRHGDAPWRQCLP